MSEHRYSVPTSVADPRIEPFRDELEEHADALNERLATEVKVFIASVEALAGVRCSVEWDWRYSLFSKQAEEGGRDG